MAADRLPRTEAGDGLERVLGRVRGAEPGPTLVGVGGIHGNEPAGIVALKSVLGDLAPRAKHVAGEFVALSGNRGALALRRRFLSSDLNRLWTAERIRELQGDNGGPRHSAEDPSLTLPSRDPSPEDRELLELHTTALDVIRQARGSVYLMDLHSASGPAQPFSSVLDSLSARRFALTLPVPLIVGLGELVEGTFMGYLADWGVSALVFEGGQHHHPTTLASLKAALWLGLAGAGVIQEAMFPEVTWARKRLITATDGLPPVMELRYRHALAPDDGFEMLPGFRSFQPVAAGQVVARDRKGEVRSPEGGRLLLPLYQAEGEDGFFLVREFHHFWLTVSEILRRLKFGRIVHWLPGVRKDPQDGERLIVDRRLARWYTMEVLHLLGYRKQRQEGDRLVVLREREGG